MVNKLMLSFVGVDFLFLGCGALILAVSLTSESFIHASPTINNVAQSILLARTPLTAGIANAIIMFITFLLSLPAMIMPNNRGWLRAQGWMVVVCALFTLIIAVSIWVGTLKTRAELGAEWAKEAPLVQSLLQQRFSCCGYTNSTSPPFIQDGTCTNSVVAADKGGCIGPFSSFADSYLSLIFTALFGVVGIDVMLILCVAMVLKHRGEQERYRHIDEKNGLGGL